MQDRNSMNILGEHYNKLNLERQSSFKGIQCLLKKFETALTSEKGILNWISEHQENINDHFGKEQITVLHK